MNPMPPPPTEEARALLAAIKASLKPHPAWGPSAVIEDVMAAHPGDIDIAPDSPLYVLLDGGWIDEPFIARFRVLGGA